MILAIFVISSFVIPDFLSAYWRMLGLPGTFFEKWAPSAFWSVEPAGNVRAKYAVWPGLRDGFAVLIKVLAAMRGAKRIVRDGFGLYHLLPIAPERGVSYCLTMLGVCPAHRPPPTKAV